MAREGLRRSARASAAAASAAAAAAAFDSDDSDIELLAENGDDSEDEYVANDASDAMEVDNDDDPDEESPAEEVDDDDAESDDGKGKGKAKVANVGGKRGGGARPPAPRRASAPRKSTVDRRKPVREAGRRSTAAARSNSTLNAFPPAYREFLLNSATTLVRKPDTWDKAPPKSFRVPPFPPGPVTPFVSALAHSPGLSAAEVEVRCDASAAPHALARREHMRDVAKRVAVIPPWDGWEGEGWWPEMCVGLAEQSQEEQEKPQSRKGKGKKSQLEGPHQEHSEGPIPGWLWRSQVRLGLDDVGRYSASNVLDSIEGSTYLQKGDAITVDLYDGTETTRTEIGQFGSAPIESTISKGFVFAAGAPVWGLDWCPCPDSLATENGFEQYVAVSTIPAALEPTTGSRCEPGARGAIQIWAVPYVDDEHLPSVSAGPRCEIVLCVEGGPVSDVKWMPMGAWDRSDGGHADTGLPKLGIVAAVQLDGFTCLYAVPQPKALRAAANAPDGPVFLSATPLAKFAVADTVCTCITWLSGHRLATGLANGHLAVWDAVTALLAGSSAEPLPCMYATLALSAIRSVAAGRCPPTDKDGALDYTGESVYIAFGSYDGTTGVVDLRDPSNTIELNRSRLPCMATAWSTQVGVPLYADVDYMVLLAQLRTNIGPATYYLTPHRGPVWEIGTSDYHTMVASASSDGALLLSNCGMGFYRRKQGGMLFQRLYEMDYDEVQHTYRMAHDFHAESTGLEEATSKAGHKNTRTKGARAEAQAPTAGDPATVKTGAWQRAVGVHRAVWQGGAGLARAGWIASCGFSGLVRVENVRGQWLYEPK